jgi:hypothetical protein
MLEHLDAAEKVLVRSVHIALRQRFGAIADESKDNQVTMKKSVSERAGSLALSVRRLDESPASATRNVCRYRTD